MNFCFPLTAAGRPRPTKAQREIRAASVAMIYAAIERLPREEALNAVVTAIRDTRSFTPEQIDRIANELGREAHERARREMSR